MIGMQYKITLPSDYDMEIIKKRVKENGFKTDGFRDLLCKCYLIQEKNVDGFENVYAPLYVWKQSTGMNEFIFDGYFDNIIHSFGWQNINIGIPLLVDLSQNYKEAKYILEISEDIEARPSLKDFRESLKKFKDEDQNICGTICIYNPDKWRYSQFLFLKNPPKIEENNLYQILHISEG
jgi:glycosyltransferase involved in cell wall biosynthesis